MFLRLNEGYSDHRKTMRLRSLMRLDTADAYPTRLWQWAVRSSPAGDLTGMEPGEIELAMGYSAMDGRLYEAMVKAGFIDVDENGARIHDWKEHTGGDIERMEDRAEQKREYQRRRREQERADREAAALASKGREGKTRSVHVSDTNCPRGQNVADTNDLRDGHDLSTFPHRPDQTRPDQISDLREEGGSDLLRGSSTTTAPAPLPVPVSRSTETAEALPVDGPSLAHCLKREVERAHPDRGFWDAGPFGMREACDIFELATEDQRQTGAADMAAKVKAFARDPTRTDFSIRAFRQTLNPRASPAQPQRPAKPKFKPLPME